MYLSFNYSLMNKKELEIVASIGSVILLTVLFILVHQTMQGMQQLQEYGFVGALVVFIIVTSAIGLKINQME
ncbi:MAG: hypothetical protein AWU59_1036 [Methanolobus sp. T82-4]|nr:MAG: hypothetical protein AWU59_1036 [Methanolobus sp. T82-4]